MCILCSLVSLCILLLFAPCLCSCSYVSLCHTLLHLIHIHISIVVCLPLFVSISLHSVVMYSLVYSLGLSLSCSLSPILYALLPPPLLYILTLAYSASILHSLLRSHSSLSPPLCSAIVVIALITSTSFCSAHDDGLYPLCFSPGLLPSGGIRKVVQGSCGLTPRRSLTL